MNVPPVARRTICVDFDGTIVPWGSLDGMVPPFAGAVEAIKAFADAGYAIAIYTSRLSPTWWRSHIDRDGTSMYDWADRIQRFGAEQKTYVESVLRNFGIPYAIITAEKIPAEYYIDDRAIEFRGDWAEVKDRVLGGPQ